eukprot:4001486-Prymnesium_polylepis.1
MYPEEDRNSWARNIARTRTKYQSGTPLHWQGAGPRRRQRNPGTGTSTWRAIPHTVKKRHTKTRRTHAQKQNSKTPQTTFAENQ